jgi:RNA polymerase sigma-70 factor, ECF subfamily
MEASNDSPAASQQTIFQNPPGTVKGGTASSFDMQGTSSRSPSPDGKSNDLVSALQAAGGEKLKSVIRRIVGSTEVADDVLQQACETFLRRRDVEVNAPGGWFRRIAINLAFTHRRKAKRVGQIEISDPHPDTATATTLVELETQWQQFDELFDAALRSLSTDQMALVNLHYRRGMTLREIAAEWRVSEVAVRRRLNRTLTRLRVAMLRGGFSRADL